MASTSKFQNFLFVSSLLLLVLTLCGTKACQEDYELGSKTKIDDGGDDDDTITETPTITATPTETATETSGGGGRRPTRTATVTPTPTTGIDARARMSGVLSDLAKEGTKRAENSPSNHDQNVAVEKPARAPVTNWLGKIYAKDVRSPIDTDRDGYTDRLEIDFGTDFFDPASFPNIAVTSIQDRLDGVDDDGDGVPNMVEFELGLNPSMSDSDEDGVLDGAELLSGSNPTDSSSHPQDSDGDGLSDNYEKEIKTNSRQEDSDGDGLRDDLELALGSNPLLMDTDADGILDAREVNLASDPIRHEGF